MSRLNINPFSVYQTLVLFAQLQDMSNNGTRKVDGQKKPELVMELMDQIVDESVVRWTGGVRQVNNCDKGRIWLCECAKLARNVWAKLGEEMAKDTKNIWPIEKYMDGTDIEVQRGLKAAELEHCGKL